jgi:hypothetical protein
VSTFCTCLKRPDKRAARAADQGTDRIFLAWSLVDRTSYGPSAGADSGRPIRAEPMYELVMLVACRQQVATRARAAGDPSSLRSSAAGAVVARADASGGDSGPGRSPSLCWGASWWGRRPHAVIRAKPSRPGPAPQGSVDT